MSTGYLPTGLSSLTPKVPFPLQEPLLVLVTHAQGQTAVPMVDWRGDRAVDAKMAQRGEWNAEHSLAPLSPQKELMTVSSSRIFGKLMGMGTTQSERGHATVLKWGLPGPCCSSRRGS